MGHSASTSGLRSVMFNYTGREAPSLKMSFFFCRRRRRPRFGLPILRFGRWLVRGQMARSLRVKESTVGQLKNKMSTIGKCFACLAWLYELFVGTLISLTNAYADCGRPTLNFIERFVLGRSVPTAKPLHLVSVGRSSNRMYRLCRTVCHECEL